MYDGNRLLLQFDKLLRQHNREHIHRAITKELTIADLEPVAELVARARAAYLEFMYELANAHTDGTLPNAEEMDNLRKLRALFIDLVDASQSFEVAIKRGYLDIKTR